MPKLKTKKYKERKHGIIIDPRLDKYNDVVLFPKQLEKANEMLKKAGIPKELQKKS